ncbi:MAG: hypothetical protein P4M12_06525 [Gammaproteobacteria bacterium]|nr:hypothetical protein [Gammaproteobacteria bacterium]
MIKQSSFGIPKLNNALLRWGGHEYEISVLVVLPDDRLASAAGDGRINFYQVNTQLQIGDIQSVLKALANNLSVATLNLQNTALNNNDVLSSSSSGNPLLECLAKNKTLTTLDLRRTKLTAKGIAVITNLMQKRSPQLTVLHESVKQNVSSASNAIYRPVASSASSIPAPARPQIAPMPEDEIILTEEQKEILASQQDDLVKNMKQFLSLSMQNQNGLAETNRELKEIKAKLGASSICHNHKFLTNRKKELEYVLNNAAIEQHKLREQKFIQETVKLTEYYYYFYIQFTGIFAASKVINTEMIENVGSSSLDGVTEGVKQVTKYLPNVADYIGKFSKYIPIIGIAGEILADVLTHFSELEKKEAVHKLTTFFIAGAAEKVGEELARQLTLSLIEKINRIKSHSPSGFLEKLKHNFEKLKNKLTAEHINTEIKEMADTHSKKIIAAILKDKVSVNALNPTLQDMQALLQTVMGDGFVYVSPVPSDAEMSFNSEDAASSSSASSMQPTEDMKAEMQRIAQKHEQLELENQKRAEEHMRLQTDVETIKKQQPKPAKPANARSEWGFSEDGNYVLLQAIDFKDGGKGKELLKINTALEQRLNHTEGTVAGIGEDVDHHDKRILQHEREIEKLKAAKARETIQHAQQLKDAQQVALQLKAELEAQKNKYKITKAELSDFWDHHQSRRLSFFSTSDATKTIYQEALSANSDYDRYLVLRRYVLDPSNKSRSFYAIVTHQFGIEFFRAEQANRSQMQP